jgi:hypothetical protein
LGLRANLLPISAPPTRPATVPAPASSVVAPFEAAPPPDDPDPPPFLEAVLRAEAPDAALFARFVELDACLLREAVLREPPPLRELLDFARVPLDFGRVPLEPARVPLDLARVPPPDLPFEPLREDPLDDFRWVLGDVLDDERALA